MKKIFKIMLTGILGLIVMFFVGMSITPKDEPELEVDTISNPLFEGYTLITVDGGDLSGTRKANVVVDIGYGDREYWAFTNEYGQLVKVIADQIILQDETTENVNANGRYYDTEAKVPGTEKKEYDKGHVIADSLGGVANAYNITPQNHTLNTSGDQAYMEKVIRDAGGCTDFVAIITYPNTETQIPSHYSFTYTLYGQVIHDEFDNESPEKKKASSNSSTSSNTSSSQSSNVTNSSSKNIPSNQSSYETASSSNKTENTSSSQSPSDTTSYSGSYIGNSNTYKFHHSWCSSIKQMKSSNKVFGDNRDYFISRGYEPCKKCNP